MICYERKVRLYLQQQQSIIWIHPLNHQTEHEQVVVLLNEPRASGAGAGSLEYWTLAKEFHSRVQSMRREFGVKEHPKLLTGRR